MATKYVMYSESPDGSNMVSTPTDKTIYTGIAYMPDSISTNPNMIDNSDFRNGMRYWSTENVVPTIINNQVMRMVAYASDAETNSLRRTYYSGTNPFSSIAIGENLYSCIEARYETGGKGSLWVGQVENRVLTPLTTTNQIYQFTMNKVSTNTVSISIDFDDVVQWTKIAVCKSPISSWKPSPADWIADKTNYTWTQTKYVMYSKNADGSGMTSVQTPETIYRGIAYLPNEILKNANLYTGTKDFSGNGWNNLLGWYSDGIYNGLTIKKRTGLWGGLCQNIQAQVDDVYTLYGYVKTDTGAKCNCQYNCGTFVPGETARVSLITTYKNGIEQASNQGNILDGDFYWMAHTFKVTEAGRLKPGFENSVDGTAMYVCGLMLVKGEYDPNIVWKTSPSDWSSDPSNYVWNKMIYTMYSASPDGSNMVETPTAQTIYRGLAYIPESIITNQNLITSSTTYQNRTVNVWDWLAPQYNLSNMGIRINDKITIFSTIKIPSSAPKGISLNARFHASDTVYTDRPIDVVNRGSALPGEEKEIYTVTPVPSTVSTSGLPPVTVGIRYSRLDSDGTGDSFTTQGKCDGIFLGDTVKTWKPSPSDWIADKANYTWTNRGTTATRYSTNIIGNDMTTDKQSNSKYVGLVSVPEDLYFRQNLLKDSAYYNNKAPFFNPLATTTKVETVILDGFKCTKVEISETPTSGYKGAYIRNDLDRIYSEFFPNDDVVLSFMIKGNIKWATGFPSLEKSTTFSWTNRKDNYPDWERVIWYGKKNEVAGAFSFYTMEAGAFTFYLRDICVQKATEFTGYKIAPQEFVTNPYNYKWEPINKTAIMYSSNPDGSGMTSVQLSKSNYVGIATIPKAVYENANLLENADFLNGTSKWIGTNGSSLNLLTQMPNGLPLPEPGAKIISNTNSATDKTGNITQQFQSLSPGTYYLSAYVLAPTEYVGSVNIAKWRFPQGGGFIESETKGTSVKNQWVRVIIGFIITTSDRYVIGIGGGVRPDGVIATIYSWHPKLERGISATEWTQSPDDWFADPANYTWVPINNRTVRYSPNPNGSGLTVDRKWDSRYRGAGNIPLDLYNNENIIPSTARFTGWIISSPNLIENKGDYSTISFDRPIATQGEGAYVDLLRKTNISLKPDTYYTFSFYEEEASGDYSTYVFSGVSITGEVNTSEGVRSVANDTKIDWTQRGNGIRKWVTFKTRSDIDTGAYKNVLFRYFYSNPKVDFKLKISRPMLVEGKDITAWKQSPSDWGDTPLNLTWSPLPDVLQPEQNGNIENMFPLTNLKISNGIYYHLNVTKDTSLPYSREIPGWTYYTVLDCKFNNTLNAGNTNILLSQLEGLVIKRRKKGTFNWITLKEIKVNSPADLNIVYQDSFLPSGSEFQYALVPILNGNIEGEYVMNEIYSSFNGVFISDNETIFKLYNAVVYGGTTANTTKGMIQPIGRRYPIMVNNSEVNYKAGQISAQLLGYKFEKTRNIDRFDIVGQTDDLTDYLNTNTAKVITDWNGNIYVSRVSNSPTISYNSAYGNGITTVTFDWVEQGKYDNQEDMYENGLVDTRG